MELDLEIDRTQTNSKRWNGRGETIALTIGDSDSDSININAEFNNSLIPNTDNAFDLGTSTGPKRWKNLFLYCKSV